MKKVTGKEYYTFFDNRVYNEGTSSSKSYPSKTEMIEEHQNKYGELLCRRTQKVWEDSKGEHIHTEYFINENV